MDSDRDLIITAEFASNISRLMTLQRNAADAADAVDEFVRAHPDVSEYLVGFAEHDIRKMIAAGFVSA